MQLFIIGLVIGAAGTVLTVVRVAKILIGYAMSLEDHNPD